MISKTIPQLLTEEQINMIAIANVLYDTTREYSQRVNDKLIYPLAKIINDPDFLEKHKVRIAEKIPDWKSSGAQVLC